MTDTANGLPPGTPRNSLNSSFSFENAGASTLAAGIATLGQTFLAGEVPAGAALVARIDGTDVPVQLDIKTTWPDGSAKMAVLSVARPELAPGATVTVVLTDAAHQAVAGPAIDLAEVLLGRACLVDLAVDGQPPLQIDVYAALQAALADGTASFWQEGALATQARVEIMLAGSQRLLFDVTAFQGGGLQVDAQFNNDRTQEAVGGRVDYDISVHLDGQQVVQQTLSQAQYQNWHVKFATNDHDGGQGLGSPAEGWLNIRQDVARLAASGAVADYDLTLDIPETTFDEFERIQMLPDYGKPFANNGVDPYMPGPGARPDLGITTLGNTVWLLTQDARAAAYALGQAEAASGIPWNFYDAQHQTWMNTENYPYLWIGGDQGRGLPGDPDSWITTQQPEGYGTTGWAPERAHQPELSFVPYLQTGERWILDNLNAQTSWTIMSLWPYPRENGAALVVNGTQQRSAAWSLRQIENALWASPDGSPEKAYLQSVSDSNWSWLVSQIPAWTARQGEAHGWLPGVWTDLTAPWQQDYFASTVIAAASRGNADALTFLEWQENFLIGRFQHAADGFNFRDGAAYVISVGDPVTGELYQTWSEIGAAMTARDLSNGTGWSKSQGEYARLAMATLAGIYALTGNTDAADAYKALAALSPPFTSEADYARVPNYAVTIPGIYAPAANPTGGGGQDTISGGDGGGGGGGGEPPPQNIIVSTPGDDVITLVAAIENAQVDLQAGNDTLTLASSDRNVVTLRNVESVYGGATDDSVTLATAAAGTVVDLNGGIDRLTFAANGPNAAIVANVEIVTGGDGDDSVTFVAAAPDAKIDLAGGADRLVLADGGNTVVVSNTETILGGSGGDTVSLETPSGDYVVDLRGGDDRLTLYWNGTNDIVVRNVEAVIGAGGNDTVRLGTALVGGSIDLRGGNDRLVLADAAPNDILVDNVETIVGGAADDSVRLESEVWGADVDLGGGRDRLQLSDGPNSLTVGNVETVIGGNAADIVTLGAAILGGQIDLGGGDDRLTLASDRPHNLTVRNIESIIGSSAADILTFGAASQTVWVDLGAGLDRLAFGAGDNTVTASNVETIVSGDGDDTVVLRTGIQGGLVDLRAGTDRLTLADGNNTMTVRRVETLVGGGGSDVVTYASRAIGAAIDLGWGIDRLFLSSDAPNSVTVSNVEAIVAGSGNDTVTLGAAAWNVSVDLGAGADRLQLSAAGANNLTLANIETVIGGAADDAVQLLTAAAAGAIELGAGFDRLTLSGDGPNTLRVGGVEAIRGAAGNDAVRFSTAGQNLTVDLDGGFDTLLLADGGNGLFATGIEVLSGGIGDDIVSLGSLAQGVVIDLGDGTDQLTLFWTGPNDVSVSNVERIFGSGGADTIRLGAAMSGSVELRSGDDLLVLSDAGPNDLFIRDVETIRGGSASDNVTLGSQVWGASIDLGGGADRLILADAPNFVTVSNVEVVLGGAGSDRIVGTGLNAMRLAGGAGGDAIAGGSGADTLSGGSGADILTGGAGADRFVFAVVDDSPIVAADSIADFEAGVDTLVFSGLLRGAFAWRGGAAFNGNGDSEARFVSASKQLLIDADGDGVGDLGIILSGVSGATLTAESFLWN